MAKSKVETLEAKVESLTTELKELSAERDAAAADFKKKAAKLTRQRDEAAAQLTAKLKVAGMGEAERQAIYAELAKTSEGGGS